MMNKGQTVTVEIPTKEWTLVIGYDKRAKKYSVGVNGMEISALPEMPMTADSYPEFCRSSDFKKYSDTIRSVTNFILTSAIFYARIRVF